MGIVRCATLEDAADILEIYSHYVKNSAISFETEPPTIEEIKKRIEQTLELYPWLVFVDNNKTVGYAYAGPFKSRCAYNWSAESTVYVHQNFQGQGIGLKLYKALLDNLKEIGVVNVIGGISLPNSGSVGLHERLGFKQVAQFKDVGFKLGKWWDVGYWQLQLEKPEEPKEVKKRQVSEHLPRREG